MLFSHSLLHTFLTMTHDGGWFSVTYEPDQDFKGMSITEFIPVRAVEYLTRTNLALGLVEKKRHCDSNFNYLTKKLKFNAHLTIPASAWFTQRNFTGHWRTRLEESGVPLNTILGIPAEPAKKNKRPREDDSDDWIELTYHLNQDFDGMSMIDHMPLHAYHYLKRTNPSLDMHGSMGKTCDAAFNDLCMTFKLAPNVGTAAVDWYTSLHAGEWRTVLKEQGTPIEEVLGSDPVVRKKARTDKLLPHFFVVAGSGKCETYSFDSQDKARRKHVMDEIAQLLDYGNGPVMTDYLLAWLCGDYEEKDIPAEYQEVKEAYAEIAPLPNEWAGGFSSVSIANASASTTTISYDD